MGIQGLLPLLKSIQKPCHLRKFAGQTIGVDAYGWLHRGTVACAIDLALDKPTTKYVDFAMNRVRMLVHFGVTPYLVFDGDYLPSKARTEKDRAARRKESRSLGLQYLKAGKSAQAQQELQKAVDVTPEMAGLLIAELKRAGVKYIVAPYEADSQLAYLEKSGIIQGILSEDSDLLVFGARCLLTKLDQYGECVMIRRDDFTACREISLVGWTDADFRKMAIMSGCDYLASIPNMGLKTAYRLLRKHKLIDRTIRAVQFDGKFRVPSTYLEDFTQAERTFLYQWVFCPIAKCMVSFSQPEEDVDPKELPYIGQYIEPLIAQGVANGSVNPHTKQPLVLPIVPRNSRPSLPLTRAKTTPIMSDLKKNHSIDSFFKPKRTPLAELDPNLFTPSPNQQQILQNAAATSWSATPVQTANPILQNPGRRNALFPTTVRRTESAVLPRTPAAPSVVSRQSTTAPLGGKFQTDFRSAKRPRLCDTGSSPVADREIQTDVKRSKFFASPRKPAKPLGDPWSDDSIEDALLDLPDFGGFSQVERKNKEVQILPDEATVSAIEHSFEATDGDTSQSTVATFGSSINPGPSEADCSPPSSPENIPASPIRVRPKGLARFAFGTITEIEKYSRPIVTQTEISSIGAQEPVVERSETSSTDFAELKSYASDLVEPGTPCLSAIQMPASSTNAVCGSEDLLVRDSEAEESEAELSRPTQFDISRFAFAAN